MIGRVVAKREDIGLTIALGQGDWVTRRLRGLLSEIIGQRVTHYRKWRVEWRLTTRIFDLITADGVGIVASIAGIIAEKAEASYSGPAISKDQQKNLRSSRGKDFAGFDNG